MTGFATKKFLSLKKHAANDNPWPLLTLLHTDNIIEYIDLAMAEHFLKCKTVDNENAAAAICYLSKAMREGHLCIDYHDSSIFPIFDEKLTQMAIKGFDALPNDIVEIPSSNVSVKPIIRENRSFYFNKMWHLEMRIAKQFAYMQMKTPNIQVDENLAKKIINEKIEQKILLNEQGAAILQAIDRSIAIINGGPGTGKTYTAGHLVKILFETMPLEKRKNWKIALAAPTGKAAANLQKSLFSAIGSISEFANVTAKTLHSLLAINNQGKRRFDAPAFIDADLIVIDECSMIDLVMMEHLLKSIRPGSRLIFLGDKHQLPPVEAGSLFSDIIDYCSSLPIEKQAVVELKKCMRAELKEIIEFAASVNNGDCNKALALLSDACTFDEGIKGIERLPILDDENTINAIHKRLLNESMEYFPFRLQHGHNDHEILHSFNAFRLLSPLRQGPLGVDTLNRLFLDFLLKKIQPNEIFVAPIIIISNDWRLQLFNGETGVLVKKMPHNSSSNVSAFSFNQGDYVLLAGCSPNEPIRRLPALLLPKFEYAYCLSVHKSQGSEFDSVLLLLPEGSENFGREVLYTGVTRARKLLKVFSTDETLKKTISNKSERRSNIKNRLANFAL